MKDKSKYEPLLLSTQQLLNEHWPQISALLQDAPINEEYGVEDIYQAAINGIMFVFVVKQENDVLLVLVTIPQLTPKLNSITIVTVAGSQLVAITAALWEYFKGWAYICGARAVDAYVPDRLVPVLTRMGFMRKSVHVRYEL
jgi:hypothetical protein